MDTCLPPSERPAFTGPSDVVCLTTVIQYTYNFRSNLLRISTRYILDVQCKYPVYYACTCIIYYGYGVARCTAPFLRVCCILLLRTTQTKQSHDVHNIILKK